MKPICKTEKRKLQHVVKNIDAYKQLCLGCTNISKCRINEVLQSYGSKPSDWHLIEIIIQHTLHTQFPSRQTYFIRHDKSVFKRTLKDLRNNTFKQSKGYNNR